MAERPALLHDWNRAGDASPLDFELTDETLRDGLQSPSAVEPPLAGKLELLERMAAIGVARASLGLPAASTRAFEHAVALARHIGDRKLALRGHLAARTLDSDLARVFEVVQRSGQKVTLHTFLGASPIRAEAEGWAPDALARRAAHAVERGVREGLEVAFVAEDATRTPPEVLVPLLQAAVDAGASSLVICDTVGASTPAGAARVIAALREPFPKVALEWHGHDDRGLALANALAALHAGARTVHATALGIGERTGNTSSEQLLMNLHVDGLRQVDLGALRTYVERASSLIGVAIPASHPFFGADAFRTATGTHAAAIAKAQARGDGWLAGNLYGPLAPESLGRAPELALGPLSGLATARAILALRGLPADDAVASALLQQAKASDRVLDGAALDAALAAALRTASTG